MNRYLRWFCPLVWAGCGANILLAVATVLTPEWLLSRLSIPVGSQMVWVRQGGMLLFFLSILYWPAGSDPLRYRTNAIVMVTAQLLIGIFWLWPYFFASAPGGYAFLGSTQLLFGVVQGILLTLSLWENVAPLLRA